MTTPQIRLTTGSTPPPTAIRAPSPAEYKAAVVSSYQQALDNANKKPIALAMSGYKVPRNAEIVDMGKVGDTNVRAIFDGGKIVVGEKTGKGREKFFELKGAVLNFIRAPSPAELQVAVKSVYAQANKNAAANPMAVTASRFTPTRSYEKLELGTVRGERATAYINKSTDAIYVETPTKTVLLRGVQIRF